MNNRFRVVARNVYLPDQFNGSVLSADAFLHIVDNKFDLNDAYTLECTVGVEFTCNRAQFDRALRDASKQVCRRLNGKTLSEINSLRMAVHAGDKLKALAICDNMDARLSGELG